MSTCSKCGANLLEGAQFCSACGAPVEVPAAEAAPNQFQVNQPTDGNAYQANQPNPAMGSAPYQANQPMGGNAYQANQPNPAMGGNPYPMNQPGMPYQYGYAAAAQTQKKNKTVGIIAVVIIVAVLAVAGVLIFRLFAGGGEKSYQGRVKGFMNAFVSLDAGKMMNYFPAPIREESESEMAAGFALLKLIYGDSIKMTYTIGEYEHLDADDIEDLEFDLEWYYDYECTVTDAYSVTITVHMTMGDMSEDSTEELIVYQTGGIWYIYMD